MRLTTCIVLLFLGSTLGSACAPEIGDDCESSVDCSPNGDRICDVASPNGYCTVRACDPDTCPEEGTCVEWRYDPDRTAINYCMRRCGPDEGCRDGYACLRAADVREAVGDPSSPQLARIIDLDRDAETTMFCVATQPAAL